MGKIVVILIGLAAILGGGGMYYLQVYGYYSPVTLAGDMDTPGSTQIRLTSLTSQLAEPIRVDDFQGIDADSSPLRFRGCFTTPQSLATLTEIYVNYEAPVPLTGPSPFDCYDADQIGADLEVGTAIAFLSEFNINYGVDRVIAIYDDGRAFAWHQINHCGEKVFDGHPAPQGCPPAPERSE